MKLQQYLSTLPRGGKTRLAKKMKISLSFLCNINKGIYKCPLRIVRHIEELTEGKVKKSEIRPDLWD